MKTCSRHSLARISSLVALVLAAWSPLPALAVEVTWTGAAVNQSWANGNNWSPATVPATGDNAFIDLSSAVVVFDVSSWTGGLFQIGAPAGVSFSQSANTLTVDGFLAGKDTGTSAGFNLSGGSFTSRGNTIFGLAGNALALQTGGTLNADSLILAEQGGNGTYTFQDGVVNSVVVYVGGFDSTGGVALFRQEGGVHNAANLWIARDSHPSAGARYELAGGSLNSGEVRVGWLAGTGVFEHSAGVHTVDTDLIVGDADSTTGFYTLSGNGVLDVKRDEIIGRTGTGTFEQIAGTHTVGGDLYVDASAPSKGTFLLSGGTLDVTGSTLVGNTASASGSFVVSASGDFYTSNLFVGNNSSGRFDQTGGSVWVGVDRNGNPVNVQLHELIVSRLEGATGTYTLSGGRLEAKREIVGDAGYQSTSAGYFHQSGDSEHTVHEDLIVGQDPLATGVFTLGDTAKLRVKGNLILGDEGGNGSFSQSGSSVLQVGNGLLIGACSETGADCGLAGQGSFTLEGSAELTVQALTVIGDAAQGSFTQNGGTFTQYGGYNALVLGAQASGVGTYTLNGGVLKMLGSEEYIGDRGRGSFVQTGGEHRTGSAVYIGTSLGGHGEYHMQGGTLGPLLDDAGTPVAYGGIVLGEWSATGKFFHTGGTVDVDNLTLGRQEGSQGYYEMSETTPGTTVLKVNGLTIGQNGGGEFVHSGGRLIASHVQIGRFGTLSGIGTLEIARLVNSGVVSPGQSPGILILDGDYVQDTDGSLRIEIANPGNYDRLVIGGHASLDGLLDVYALAGYSPAVGDSFMVLTTGNGLAGGFDQVKYHGFGSGIVFKEVDYNNGMVTLEIAAVPEARTWAMLLGGLGLLVFRLRRRQAACQ